MELATQKLEIIRLILSLEEASVLSILLAYLESREDNIVLEKGYVSKSETDKLLADYESKVSDLETDMEMDLVLSQYTDDEKLTLALLLRARDARENRDDSREASKVFAKYLNPEKNHVEEV